MSGFELITITFLFLLFDFDANLIDDFERHLG